IGDGVGWGLEMTPETLVATQVAASLDEKETKDLARSLSCPVLVIHGDRDWIVPHAQGAALAEVSGGRLVTMKGSGHIPLARDPVKFNLLLRDFVEPAPAPATWLRGRSRKQRDPSASPPT